MRTFNEDTRVKIPATIQFLRLGYEYQSLNDKDVFIDFGTKIFINRFKPAIERINNRAFSDDEILKIISDINTLIEYDDLGKTFYDWLIHPKNDIKLIDFDNINNNDFAVVDELSFSILEGTDEGSFRPDVNVLINGIPLAFLEVKPPNNEGGIQKEFNRMIDSRLKNRNYKKYFNMIQIVSFSNNMEYEEDADAYDVKAGSFYTTLNGKETTFSFFREQEYHYHEDYHYLIVDDEKIKYVLRDCGYSAQVIDTPEFQENIKVSTPCNKFITSLFDKERLLFILRYGFMFIDGQVHEKHIMRYPQFYATRNILKRLESGDKRGIVWHTQGSGKTELAAYANRIISDFYAKKGITARFYFIVDRLYLLNQASLELHARGYSIIPCPNKDKFGEALNQPLPDHLEDSSIGDFCVVNIQRIDVDNIPKARNDYGVNVQRIFFVDEAHRSYAKSTGTFFKNLMLCDDNGAFIALTGTPLLSKKERTTYRFGDYIDTYFYDKSIADGYTLKIKKEPVDTKAIATIKNNLMLEDDKLNDKSVYDSPAFLKALAKFIEQDFIDFKTTQNDPSVGGMIVCKGNEQAKFIFDWFKNNSSLSAGLVLSDPENKDQSADNKRYQEDFAKPGDPNNPLNILVVNYMLTTGYDAHRLKKLYLLRGAHSHSLLQTISRVNRPYISPNGVRYKYGYLVDFADIDNEYNKTIASYTRELEGYYNEGIDETYHLDDLLDSVNEIHDQYIDCLNTLKDIIPIDNLEIFSRNLEKHNKDELYSIRKLLNTIKECEIEFELSKSDYASEIDINRISKLASLTQHRIDFLNLKGSPIDNFNILTDSDVIEIVYEFKKGEPSILDLDAFIKDDPGAKEVADLLIRIREAIANNKNKDDARIRRLDEILKEIFAHLSISSETGVDDALAELNEVLTELKGINNQNDELSHRYGDQYAFVKAYQDALDKYQIDEDDLEEIMDIIYTALADYLRKDVLYKLGRRNFINNAKSKVTTELVKKRLFGKVKDCYDDILDNLYKCLMLYD